jgi:sialate O-acetylesterase
MGGIFHGRVAPLAPFGFKGALWYQGESNGGDDDIYFHKTRAMLTCWGKTWGQLAWVKPGSWWKFWGPSAEEVAAANAKAQYEFPFYFVQLADFQGANDNPAGGDGWAKIRMAQSKCLEIPKTGMAVAIDIGNAGDIHPRNKEDVGNRLAFWALAKEYGQKDLVCSGPLYKSMTVEGGKIRVSFDYVGKGLMVGRKEGHGPAVAVVADAAKPEAKPALKRFAIAGEDKQWFWADAVIDGSTVLVSSTNVPSPVAVRYAFSMNPAGCNLYNKDGLPASPFRTDIW